MSLEAKTVTELRGIAQAVGVAVKWSDTKPQLIDKIAAHASPPPPPDPVVFPSDPGNAAQVAIAEALKPFTAQGLRLTFPDADTWHAYTNRRSDSGTVHMPIWAVVNCARQVMGG